MVLSKLLKSRKKDKDKEKEKKRAEKIKKILLEKKERIEKELEKLVDLNKQKPFPDFGPGDEVEDEEEQADEVEEIGNSLAIRNVLEKELENIQEALKKIGRGKYGICENCAKPIKLKKLKIKPSSKYCVKCVKEMESR
jgi:DnaK suppressor protein